jgi:hypothetical protein
MCTVRLTGARRNSLPTHSTRSKFSVAAISEPPLNEPQAQGRDLAEPGIQRVTLPPTLRAS